MVTSSRGAAGLCCHKEDKQQGDAQHKAVGGENVKKKQSPPQPLGRFAFLRGGGGGSNENEGRKSGTEETQALESGSSAVSSARTERAASNFVVVDDNDVSRAEKDRNAAHNSEHETKGISGGSNSSPFTKYARDVSSDIVLAVPRDGSPEIEACHDALSRGRVRKLGQGQFGAVYLVNAPIRIPGTVIEQDTAGGGEGCGGPKTQAGYEGTIHRPPMVHGSAAIKVLHESDTIAARDVDDFRREMKLIRSFNHPNILAVLGVSETTLPMMLITDYAETNLEKVRHRPCVCAHTQAESSLCCACVHCLHNRSSVGECIRFDSAGLPESGRISLVLMNRTGSPPFSAHKSAMARCLLLHNDARCVHTRLRPLHISAPDAHIFPCNNALRVCRAHTCEPETTRHTMHAGSSATNHAPAMATHGVRIRLCDGSRVYALEESHP